MVETPTYFAVIPADVRYHNKLASGAKLLYGEITALTNREGFCWASNAYFARLYEVDTRTIRRWLSSLKDCGFIYVENDTADGNTLRKIFLAMTKMSYPMTKMSYPQDENVPPPHDKNVPQIIQDMNNKNNNNIAADKKVTYPQRFKKPTLEEIEKYIQEKNLNVDGKQFFEFFETGDWHDSKGNKVKNWKQKLLTWNKFHGPKVQQQPVKESNTWVNPQATSEEELDEIRREAAAWLDEEDGK